MVRAMNNPDSPADVVREALPVLALVNHAYEKRLRKHGATPRGVFWRSEDSARLRFKILLRVIRAEDAAGGLSAADLGCGYGAFWDYIKDAPFMKGGAYTGCDMSEAMIAEARARINDPRAQFERGVYVKAPVDYGFASGVFNMNLGADERAWEDYIHASLRLLWAQCRKGMAFNMLSAKKREDMRGLYYADPDAIFAFCRERLSADAELIEDYPAPDFTVLVRR